MKFLAHCLNPQSPDWMYSSHFGDVQIEADSAADARKRLTVIYANPATVVPEHVVRSIPWQNPHLVEIDEVSDFDPSVPVAIVTAP